MSIYTIRVSHTFAWDIEVDAENETDALLIAPEVFKENEDGITGVADGESFVKEEFMLKERE